jgi:hypothetical protein
VVASDDGSGNKRLAAYVCPTDAAPSVALLRRHLQDKLPAFMVPQAFVVMDRLPMTANGKLDVSNLPAPGVLDRSREIPLPPQSAVERAIASVWEKALGVTGVGLHQSFFDLGGHSMLLIQIQRELTEALRREVSLIDLFKYPTIDALAAFVATGNDQRPSFDRARARAAERTIRLERPAELSQAGAAES